MVIDGRRDPIAEVDDELSGKCFCAGYNGHYAETIELVVVTPAVAATLHVCT